LKGQRFYKYHGTGNDFIIFDNRSKKIVFTEPQIASLCHRQFGIGADGLMMILPSDVADFEMKYYNSDGFEGTMCGNGSRCLTALAGDLGIINDKATFLATDGLHQSEILAKTNHETYVRVKLNDINQFEKQNNYFIIDSGSPHYIEFVEDIHRIDVFARGKAIRWDARFEPGGINVNFAEFKSDRILVKTFERGVENITLSCGTGVTATTIAANLVRNTYLNRVMVETDGGTLFVEFKKEKDTFTDIWLEGPTVKVFEGEIETDL
jgi:diaminopimelate epimerase